MRRSTKAAGAIAAVEVLPELVLVVGAISIVGVLLWYFRDFLKNPLASVVSAAKKVGDDYVHAFYGPANDYGANTVVTHSQDQTPGASAKQPDINTDPFIWGTSF